VPTIQASTSIDASRAKVFAYAADYRNATKLVPGLTRFDPTGDKTDGLGASFAAVFEIGPKRFEATLAVTTFEPDRQIGWTSTSGAGQSLLWTFEQEGVKTAVTFDLGFELPNGLAGNILSLTVDPILRSRARETAAALRSQVEGS
jgi:hypothetical protein